MVGAGADELPASFVAGVGTFDGMDVDFSDSIEK